MSHEEVQLSPGTVMQWTGAGWLNTDVDAGLLRLFDVNLQQCCQVPVADLDRSVHVTAAVDGSRFALVGLDGVTVIAADAATLWHRPERIAARYEQLQPAGHFDHAGRLWLYVPTTFLRALGRSDS